MYDLLFELLGGSGTCPVRIGKYTALAKLSQFKLNIKMYRARLQQSLIAFFSLKLSGNIVRNGIYSGY